MSVLCYNKQIMHSHGQLMFDKYLKNICCPLLAFLGVISIWQTAVAEPLPRSFSASYEFSRNGLNVGYVKRNLHVSSDGGYTFESVSEATGFISLFVRDKIFEHSIWTYANNRPRPSQYVYRRDGGRKERHVKLNFDWQEGVVTNTINDDPWQMHIPPDAQDKLLYQLTLMIDLKAGKQNLHYEIADGGTLKDYEFVILGQEKIDSPMGELDTVKLERVNDVRHTTIWCAKSLDYLPVRIEQVEKDNSRLALLIHDVTGLPVANVTPAAASPALPE